MTEERGERTAEEKRALRREMKARRAALSAEYTQWADAEIRAAVLSSDAYRRAERLFVYVSVPGEPDTRGLIAAALRDGKRVYVPKCLGKGEMLAARIRSLKELVPGALSIPEPREISETAPASAFDLILAPCVAAGADGRRLGHGAGYYDRFLRGAQGPVWCLCYENMRAEDIPVDARDVSMDAVITEQGNIMAADG